MRNPVRMTGSSLSIVEALFRQLHIDKGTHVVDVGFGNNGELAILASFVGKTGLVYGVEPTRRRAKRTGLALHPPNVRVLPGDAARLPLSENSVDLALYKGTLHEIRNIKAALSEAKRVCRDQGDHCNHRFLTLSRSMVKGIQSQLARSSSLEDL